MLHTPILCIPLDFTITDTQHDFFSDFSTISLRNVMSHDFGIKMRSAEYDSGNDKE